MNMRKNALGLNPHSEAFQPSSKLNLLPKSKVDSMPIDVSIIVPSTRKDKKVSKKEFSNRIDETGKFMIKIFGGDTTSLAHGGYKSSSGKEIKEDVASVNASMTYEQFNKNKDKLAQFIKDKQKDWNQETIAFKVENDLKLYPKRGKEMEVKS